MRRQVLLKFPQVYIYICVYIYTHLNQVLGEMVSGFVLSNSALRALESEA